MIPMTDEREVIADGEELTKCPDCGNPLNAEPLEGEMGVRHSDINCGECGFRGREFYVIDKTVRLSDRTIEDEEQ